VRAAADDHPLLLNASIHVVQPLINPNVGYDVVNDIAHIALIAVGPLLVTTHPTVAANTLKEFLDALTPSVIRLPQQGLFQDNEQSHTQFRRRTGGLAL
jgi:hypothetical protein